MGKYILYAFFIVVVLFFLEWFKIVDIPYVDIPDWFSGKQVLVHKTQQELDKIK